MTRTNIGANLKTFCKSQEAYKQIIFVINILIYQVQTFTPQVGD